MRKIGIVLVVAWLLAITVAVNAEENVQTHTYTQPGTYPVTVTVTDEFGATTTETITINVRGNAAPTVTIVANPTTGLAPLTVTFAATAVDPDGDTMTYRWDFGDGNTASLLNTEHTYTSAGEYHPTFKATDSEGNVTELALALAVKRTGIGCS